MPTSFYPQQHKGVKAVRVYMLTVICDPVGSLDPYLDGSMAMYNVCNSDKAILFDHAKGHTLPRDKDTVTELGDVIREMIADVREQQP